MTEPIPLGTPTPMPDTTTTPAPQPAPPAPVLRVPNSLIALVYGPILLLAALVGYDHFHRAPAPGPVGPQPDAAVVEIGEEYRPRLVEAAAKTFEATAAADFGNDQALIKTNQDTLKANLKAAFAPVQQDLTTRFGPATDKPLDTDAVQSRRRYLKDLAVGIRKGAK